MRLKYSDVSRKVMRLAHQEAEQHGHFYVGTEHLLIALFREAGPARDTLTIAGIDLDRLRREVEKLVESWPPIDGKAKLPLAARTQNSDGIRP
jgi:ATP-dependent Clp protease ATP-binding subunit ClpC